jgi:hypothetical protein
MQVATTSGFSLLQGRTLTFIALCAVLLAAGVSLTRLFDTSLINPDTVQLISAARHLFAGDGLLTSIVYYESQLEFGRTPAPLTVWPPGFAVLLAGGMKLGLDPAYGAFAMCLLSHLAVSFLLYAGLRRLGVRAVIGLIAALVWALHPGAWSMVLSAYTEPLFTALTLGSCFALLESERDRERSVRWLISAGLLAASAVLVRYSGVLWPMAVGAWALLAALRGRSWRPIGRALVFAAAPLAATTGLFVRNYLLSGLLSGGQFDYGGAVSLTDALRRTYWEAGSIFGSLATVHPLVLMAAVSMIGLAVVVLLRRGTWKPREDMIVLGGVYVLGLGAFLLLNAMTASAGFLDYRYWLPGLPFLLCVLALAADAAAGRVSDAQPRWKWAQLGVLGAAGVIAVSAAAELAVRWPIAPVHISTAVIERALAETLPEGGTLRDALTARQDLDRPLLAHHEHRFSLATGRAALGLPDARFSQRVWTTQAVATIVRQQRIREVVFFPAAYDRKAANNRNTPFFHELSEGRVPPWLTPWRVTDTVAVYHVDAARL